MTLPLMDRDQAGRLPRSALPPLTVDATVSDAADRLLASGDQAIVLWQYGRPAAVATRAAIHEAIGAGRGDERAGAVADLVAVPVDRGADALATLHAFTRAAWDWLWCDRSSSEPPRRTTGPSAL